MCDDLVSFTFIFNVFSQFSTVWRCSWRLREAVVGSPWVANIAVTSANVPNVGGQNQDAGKWSTSRPEQFTSGETTLIPTEEEA